MAAAAGLGLAEMIASGVTCIADMYMRTGVIAQQVLDAAEAAKDKFSRLVLACLERL